MGVRVPPSASIFFLPVRHPEVIPENGSSKSRRATWLVALLCGATVLTGAIYGSRKWAEREPATDAPPARRPNNSRPLAIAHRGGAGLWPENTLYAFERAVRLGVDVLELDVRSVADGTLVVMHDATVDRTTDGSGRVSEMSLAELKRLDAGYRWSPDGGKSFPLRGSGIEIPTLAEVFEALPETRFVIEPKRSAPSVARSLCRAIRQQRIGGRVTVGSFSQSMLDEFRRECTEVATSASTGEVSKFLLMYKIGMYGDPFPGLAALQIPEQAGGLQLVSRGFIEAAHARNIAVHVWTINDTTDMRRLLDMGVDGIMTDYPDRLLKLLGREHER